MYPISLLLRWVTQWAHDRNIIFGTKPRNQFNKAQEEMAELRRGIQTNDVAEVKDGIGDVIVCLNNIAAQYGLTVEECLNQAWDDIKDRKGRIINGKFVKEADLP